MSELVVTIYYCFFLFLASSATPFQLDLCWQKILIRPVQIIYVRFSLKRLSSQDCFQCSALIVPPGYVKMPFLCVCLKDVFFFWSFRHDNNNKSKNVYVILMKIKGRISWAKMFLFVFYDL